MLENIQHNLDILFQEQNNRPNEDFEGLSASQMHNLLFYPLEDGSIVKINKLSDPDYTIFPFFNQTKYLLDYFAKNGEVKLTAKGFLPIKVVKDVYNQGFIKNDYFESGFMKLNREYDSVPISLSRTILDIAHLTKKRNNKVSITKSGEKALKDNAVLFQIIFETFVLKFNWASFDGYGDNDIGQIGFGFSVFILGKYGNEKQLDSFYANKYFTALPVLKGTMVNSMYCTLEEYISRCYSFRTFEQFMCFFGLITIESEKAWGSDKYILKTEAFDRLFTIVSEKAFKLDGISLN